MVSHQGGGTSSQRGGYGNHLPSFFHFDLFDLHFSIIFFG